MRSLPSRAVLLASLVLGLGAAHAQRVDDPTRIAAEAGAYATLHDPVITWRLSERLRVSAIYDVTRLPLDPLSRDLSTAVVEPAYEVALSAAASAFFGLGVGVAHLDDAGLAAAAAPRVGLHLAGGVTASATYQIDAHDAISMPGEVQYGIVLEGTW
jgi:hypothetical protein